MSDLKIDSYQDINIWMRGLYMLIFLVFQGVAKFVLLVVVAVQFLNILFTDKANPKLLNFGNSLSQYQYQIFMFLTFNSEELPYPFNDWPLADATEKGDSKEPGS